MFIRLLFIYLFSEPFNPPYTPFKQMSCFFDPQVSVQRSPLDRVFRLKFLPNMVCIQLCKCLYMVCKHFCNYHVEKQIWHSNPEQVSYECLYKINTVSIALQTIFVTIISVKKQIPFHICSVKDPISAHVLFCYTRKGMGCGVRLKWKS